MAEPGKVERDLQQSAWYRRGQSHLEEVVNMDELQKVALNEILRTVTYLADEIIELN